MANAAIDQDIVDQLAVALGVSNTAVLINMTDTGATFSSKQEDGTSSTDIKHTFTLKTSSPSLMSAIVAAVQATGRP